MVLHRDIHWIGRQWAVTGYGMQAIDRKVAGKFDVEIARLWDEDLEQSLRAQKWFNPDDFSKGLAVARARYPQPRQEAAPPPEDATPEAPPLEAAPPEEVIPPAPEHNPVEPEPVELKEPEILQAEPVETAVEPPQPVEPPPPAPQEDLLEKWFKKLNMERAPAPPRKVLPSLPEPPVQPGTASSPPELPRTSAAPEQHENPMPDAIEPPKPAAPKFQMQLDGCRARFVRPWHVRIRRLKP